MNIIKGNLDQQKIYANQDLDLTNATYIFLQNNGSVPVFFGNRKIGAGKEVEINLQFLIKSQIIDIRFENTVGDKELYVMLGKAILKCN